MLATLLLIPLFVVIYRGLLRKRELSLASMGSMGIIQNSSGGNLGKRRHIPPLFFLIGLAFLLFSAARPEMFIDLPRVEGTVILAFDVSSSMIADDLQPTRMEAAKVAARNFVENQPETVQIGVVAFSNGGIVVQPPTDDQTAILDTIDRLTPQGATSLSQGIFSALNALAGEAIAIDPEAFENGTPQVDLDKISPAAVLMLTDGEDTTALDPLEIAQLAAEAGVRIYPVGLGSPEGTVIELEGFNILSQLNEPTLIALADMTNGAYYQAEDEETLQEIYENIDLHLSISGEKIEVTAILAAIGLMFFLIGAVFSMLWFGRMP